MAAHLAHLELSGTAGVQSSRNRSLTCRQAHKDDSPTCDSTPDSPGRQTFAAAPARHPLPPARGARPHVPWFAAAAALRERATGSGSQRWRDLASWPLPADLIRDTDAVGPAVSARGCYAICLSRTAGRFRRGSFDGSQIPRKWLWRISPALVVRSATETGSSIRPRRSPHWRVTDPGQPSREQCRQPDSARGDNAGIPSAKPQFAGSLPKEHQQAGGSPESGPPRAGAPAAPLPRSRAAGRACAGVAYCPGVRSRYRASSRQ